MSCLFFQRAAAALRQISARAGLPLLAAPPSAPAFAACFEDRAFDAPVTAPPAWPMMWPAVTLILLHTGHFMGADYVRGLIRCQPLGVNFAG